MALNFETFATHQQLQLQAPHDAFEMQAEPNTDMWEKPPSTHSFNAPVMYHKVRISDFRSISVRVKADWTHKYDQGGVCMVMTTPDGRRRWVKAGIEFYENKPYVAMVATDQWSDWSLRPSVGQVTGSAHLEMKLDDGSLWAYAIEDDGTRIPMREVTWFSDLPKDTECWVGVYCCRPSTATTDVLKVQFKNLYIQLA